MNLPANDNLVLMDKNSAGFNWYLVLGSLLFFGFYFWVALKTSFVVAIMLVIALPLLILFCYYLFKIPGLAIGLMIAATSLDVVGRLTAKGAALGLTVFHLMFLVSLVIFIFRKLWDADFSFKKTRIDFALLLFLIIIGISIFWSRDRQEAMISLGRLVALIIAMYLTLNMVESKASVKLVAILIFIPALILSVYAGRDFVTASSVEVKNALSMLKLFSRFGATFENPNYFATFLLLPLCLSFAALSFFRISFWKKGVYFIIPMAIFGVAFVGTFSRSAWVALFAAYLYIFAYFKNKKYWILGALITLIILAVALYQTAFFQSFVLRFASIFEGKTDPSSATRIFLIAGGWQMFVKSYFFGVGFESFPIEYHQHYQPPGQALGYVHECHTLPMEILAELGLIGLIIFAVIIYRTIQFGMQVIRQTTDNFYRTIQIGLVAFFLGLLVNFLFMPGGILNNLFWIGMGLIWAIGYLVSERKSIING